LNYFSSKNRKMKLILRFILLFPLILVNGVSRAQLDFSDYFTGERFRYDFVLAGNFEELRVYPLSQKREPHWAGSKKSLVDTMGYGTYRYRVMDDSTGKVIFSRGFCTLAQEWQTTAEAKRSEKAFYQALFFPFPKQKVRLSVDSRNWQGEFVPVFETVVDPADYFIIRDKPEEYEVFTVLGNGLPDTHVDLVFLAEGYTAGEKEKFVMDAARMCENIMNVSPFRENRDKFNIQAVWTPSQEGGTDIPGENIYRNTRFNSTFYTFDVARYLTTSDMRTIYDAVSGVPWDHLLVLVNSERYGGGGFYNFLTVCTAGHALTPKVLVHELGHAFAGLGDEYYDSEVAYENYYNLAVEPWEPNLTTLVDFASKWKHLVPDSIPVPTPRTPEYLTVTGVFEGGGYLSKGIFSPMQNCRMKSNGPEEFCSACKRAILAAIEWHTR